jgi:signal transduction histidine kinase
MRSFVAMASLATVAATALAGIVYGGHAAVVTLAVLAPLGVLTVAAARQVAVSRVRIGGLRRQVVLVGVLAVGQLMLAVALFARLMFVSNHDAFFMVLVVAYASLLALCAGRLTGRQALVDLQDIRTTLERVGRGERRVRSRVRGGDELGQLALDVNSMAERLNVEEDARRQLIAAVSHDLRTPITSIRLLAEAVDDQIVDPGTRTEYLRRMTTHVRQLGALIDDLFELSRLETGDLRWTMEQVRLSELLADTVEAMTPQASAGGVELRAEVGSDATARANPEQIQRVLFNLVQNAIRHTPADGAVVVRAQPVDHAVEIEVADNGEGIPTPDRERIFEPFVQGAARSARTDGSAGLGLAIARAIVEAHGGRIWLADSARGTSVRFSLPAEEVAVG